MTNELRKRVLEFAAGRTDGMVLVIVGDNYDADWCRDMLRGFYDCRWTVAITHTFPARAKPSRQVMLGWRADSFLR